MGQPVQPDEQSISNQVHKIIDDLIAFDKDSRARIYRTVGTFFGFDEPEPRRGVQADEGAVLAAASREPHFSLGSDPSPKDFLFEKGPTTVVDRVACLAYYLTHYRTTLISRPRISAPSIPRLHRSSSPTLRMH